MKKKFILLCLGVFLLCGCEAKFESEFTINEDKSMNIEMFMGFDDAMLDFMMSSDEEENEEPNASLDEEVIEQDDELSTKTYTDEERLEYIRSSFVKDSSDIQSYGFNYKEYQDETYTGYIITKKIDNIDNLTGTQDFNLSNINEIDSKKIFTKDGNVYKGKILIDESEEPDEYIDISEDMDTSEIENMNFVKYNFILNLPNKAISSNATTVSEDGKTLTWDLSKGNIEAIEFEFEFPSMLSFIKNNMFLVAGIAIVIVLLIVIVITVILKKAKKKNNDSLDDVSNTNISEPVIEKNDSITAINGAQINLNDINQTAYQPIQDIIEPTVNNQIQNGMSSVQSTLQEISQIQPMTEQPNINMQQNIETQVTSLPQNNIAPTINQAPVIPTIQPEMPIAPPQPEVNIQQPQVAVPNIVQDNNTIPEIKPIVPQPINVQPISQENIQPVGQQTVNQQPNLGIVTNGLQQNGIVQPDNPNINNGQGI